MVYTKSVEIINFKSNNSVCTQPPDYPLFGKANPGNSDRGKDHKVV